MTLKPAYRFFVLLIIGLSIISALGCAPPSPLLIPTATFTSTASQGIDSLPSLQDQWGLLEAKAHEWKSDSFLTAVFIDVNGHATYQMMTSYYSPSARNSLTIAIENSGEITTLLNTRKQSNSLQPIQRENWAIDSQEALLAFSDNEMIKSCLQSTDPSKQPIDMTLILWDTDFAVWKLDILNCPKSDSFELKSYYLDAQTGETVNPLEN